MKDLAKPPEEDREFARQVADYETARKRDSGLDTETVREPRHVLLTGVTGTLGIYLLRELLTATKARVTAIVRAKDGDRRTPGFGTTTWNASATTWKTKQEDG